MPKANPPAENVPKALLNPLLSVAPTYLSYNNLKLAINIKETAKLIHKNEISGDPLVSSVGWLSELSKLSILLVRFRFYQSTP